MNVKRYIVHDVSEAMIKIKNELGSDAIILNQRKIKTPGIRGIFKKPMIEVVAAVDDGVSDKRYGGNGDYNSRNSKNNKLDEEQILSVLKSLEDATKIKSEEKTVKIKEEKIKHEEDGEIRKELSELKDLVNTLAHTIKENEVEVDRHECSTLNETDAKAGNTEEEWVQKLLGKDITRESIVTILEVIKNHDYYDAGIGELNTHGMKLCIQELLGTPTTIETKLNENRIFLFVGPTGVGKTTTLAKLAAKLSLIDNKSVGLITADTYRIAAVDQLKTYSEILGIPLKVIYEPEEISDAVEKYADKDCILIDTAGRSHKSKELKKDMDDLLAYLDSPEVFLVVSMTTGYSNIKSIIDSYGFLKNFTLIFTKLDEASSLGNILNVKLETGRELSYFTIGQSVPDDIEVANVERIACDIVGD